MPVLRTWWKAFLFAMAEPMTPYPRGPNARAPDVVEGAPVRNLLLALDSLALPG